MNIAHINQEEIKIISFNLKNDFRFAKKNRWNMRRETVAQLIRESGAAIIGVQEMSPQMKTDIEEMLSDEYDMVGDGRYCGKHKDKNANEYSSILLKKSMGEFINHRTFWLSKQEEVMGSYFSSFPRICTVADILLYNNNQRIRVFNTHFDHISAIARVFGARLILRNISKANEIDPLPTVFMGDLNTIPKSKAIKIISSNLHDFNNVHLNNAYLYASPNAIYNTYHSFSGKVNHKKQPIDYIFFSDEFHIKDCYIYSRCFAGIYPSDHFPIVATVNL